MKAIPPQEFKSKCRFEEEKLNGITDLTVMIKHALDLADNLCYVTTLKDYELNHSSFLPYLQVLHKVLDSPTYTQEILKKAYLYSMSFRHILPRLYISMVIASLLEDTTYLSNVCSMLISECQPLQGLMLRFTAISFFPLNSPLLAQFCVTNFNEMLYLTKGFLETYPNEIKTAAGWISSNISMSLAKVHDSFLINHYIETAISCDIKEIGESSLEAISYSIPREAFEQFIPNLKLFYTSHPITENTTKIIAYIIETVPTAKLAYEFSKGTTYENLCNIEIAKRCFNEKDYETLKNIADKEEVAMIIIIEAGSEKFIEIGKPFARGSVLTIEFLRRITPNIKVETVRRFLEAEIEDMKIEIYETLKATIMKGDFPADYFAKLFAPPFKFQSTDFLMYVVSHGYRMGVSRETLIGYIRVSKMLPPSVRAAAMGLVMHIDELIFYILGLSDQLSRMFLINKIDKAFPKEYIPKILEKCETSKEIQALFNAVVVFEDNSLAGQVLDKLLEKDSDIETNEGLINFYFVNIINTIYGASEERLPVSQTTIEAIFQHVLNAVKTAIEFPFPLTTPKKMKHWKKIVSYGPKIDNLYFIHPKITEIIELIEKLTSL
ncbi:hypothetical protein TVAG_300160 [Trichomonas vaginalis G3]|uniref:Uncharacterized protein n=1 Tax=Trichomonas vaginalis (strain ATCC PRA-98 / G3) TaxID=412133 RepID=A2G203_TRIV3|nr:hypothetical protein TVAGG3_0478800 [Trichomonas vaginalis G3]EAX88817.1 hypothetical protein TVAG_300160 [Trichomonas vaginalis G3]KAI5515556.1 hypothetical protein TVAGG3_0478800 [Trichomonas vaginalis G3]|eukprot:XP_001301747.1 hypothetical protein [Trichomonas vaginalis G3]